MVSLDQVLLLQEKVESAVQKIAQLNQENDALRTRCSELTKALSQKTEQLSAFASDQNKIEEGILKALERLNSVENTVLKAAALTGQNMGSDSAQVQNQVEQQTSIQTEIFQNAEEPAVTAVDSVSQAEVQPSAENAPSVSNLQSQETLLSDYSEPENVQPESVPENQDADAEEKNETDKANGQFYIF